MPTVDPIPAEYGSVSCYLVLRDCAKAIDFYAKVFGGTERMRMPMPDGKIGHAELLIGNRIVMLADGNETFPPTNALLCLYVEDCDAVFDGAIAAGATVIEAVTDKFYGDRAGTLADPFGQRWSIITHKEDVSPDEMRARMAKLTGG